MIFIIAETADRKELKQYEDRVEAERYCATFLREHRRLGGTVKVFEGRELDVKVVSVVDVVELK